METLTANLGGKTRRETRNGREYVVAPMTLIVPGVLNGSQGPLLYSAEEIKKNVMAWNGMPIVVGHPYDASGNPISARTPSVLDAQGIGEVFNAQVNGKLIAEGWFDVEKTQKVDSRILNSLDAENLLELSTALFTANKPASKGSVHNDKPYSYIASNHRPDHLAILVDSKGACSINDGCGVNVNEATREQLVKRIEEYQNDCGVTYIQNQEVLIGFVGRANKHVHAVTVSDVGDGIAHMTNGHVHSIQKFVVTSSEGHSHALKKTTLVDSGVRNEKNNKKESIMDEKKKREIVDNLIANVCCWEEEDREVLNGFGDKKLEGMHKIAEAQKQNELVVNAAKKGFTDPGGNTHTWNEEKSEWVMKKKEPKELGVELVANEKKKKEPQTAEEWMKSAPKEIQTAVQNSMDIVEREKTILIEKLTANLEGEVREQHSKRLQERSLEDLHSDLALLPQPQGEEATHNVSYAGASTPASSASKSFDENEFLSLPVLNFEEEKQTA